MEVSRLPHEAPLSDIYKVPWESKLACPGPGITKDRGGNCPYTGQPVPQILAAPSRSAWATQQTQRLASVMS